MKIQQIAPYVWPSGWCFAIASLAMTPDQLTERYGLTFERGEDDGIGTFSLTAIALLDGSQCWLKYHDYDPTGHTNIFVDEHADLVRARDMVLEVLGLTTQDLAWINPHSNGVSYEPPENGLAAYRQEQLIEVWAVINALSTSLLHLRGTDREYAQAEFFKYANSPLLLHLSRARKVMDEILVTSDLPMDERLSEMGNRLIPYWKEDDAPSIE